MEDEKLECYQCGKNIGNDAFEEIYGEMFCIDCYWYQVEIMLKSYEQ